MRARTLLCVAAATLLGALLTPQIGCEDTSSSPNSAVASFSTDGGTPAQEVSETAAEPPLPAEVKPGETSAGNTAPVAKPAAAAAEAAGPAPKAAAKPAAGPKFEVKPAGTVAGAAPTTTKAVSNPTEEPKPGAKTKAPPVGAEPQPKPAVAVALPALPALPKGLPELKIPADNPMTPEKVELGKLLYFDKRVSKDDTVSCATCHAPKRGWAESMPVSTGIGKQQGGRNAPSIINAAYAKAQFWDGRAATLEEQATGPVENPIEMGSAMNAVCEKLSKIPGYRERFEKVFGTGVTKEGFAKAIAAFERTVLSGNSLYDRFQAGEKSALNDVQKKGMELFNTKGCADCHAPPLFSTYEYHNAGVSMDKEKPDEGRKAVTKKDEDTGAFRVPALRAVAHTGPYFHDGSAKTLADAVALMAAGGKDNPHLSDELKSVREANLTADDQAAIVEFLKALTGKYPVVLAPALP